MAKNFKTLREKMSPEAQARSREKAAAMLKEMPLAELRQARQYSQEELAAALDIKQPAVAKIEKRADMYISTMRRFVEAMGGQLEIKAWFPDGEVRIDQFKELGKSGKAPKTKRRTKKAAAA